MLAEIQNYHSTFSLEEQVIAALIYQIISKNLIEAEHKIWHRHPVWFIEGNPIVGYSKQKKGIRLMFWSGADFEEKDLNILCTKFKDASIYYTNKEEINTVELVRWLDKAKKIQWDYKNIVKRRGVLERLK